MINDVYIQENLKHKIFGFLINLFLIFGLLCIPESDMIPKMPGWYDQLDLYLTIVLSIPLIWQTYMLFKKTGLKLNSQGIEENMSQMNVQKFSWNEIVSVKFMKIFFLKYILIYITDPASYLKKQKFYRRIPMLSNYKKLGTPIKIPIHAIDKTPQEIANIISEYTNSLMAQRQDKT
ncbi:MAG: STM3941 family protein [Bdellovibrionota bacterium]